MNAFRAVPVGVIAGGVPAVVAIVPFGLMSAVKFSLTSLPASMSAEVTGMKRPVLVDVEAGKPSLTLSACMASQYELGDCALGRPDSAQCPLLPATLAPEM